MSEREWRIGDRVLVLPDDGWLLPTRKYAAESRPATVRAHLKQIRSDCYRVDFDVKRKGAQPHSQIVYANELTPLSLAL